MDPVGSASLSRIRISIPLTGQPIFKTSVAYPYQNPYPTVFGQPGSGPGLSSHIGRKTLIPTVLRFRYDSTQRHGSADPDPFQNVTDPQHWWKLTFLKKARKVFPTSDGSTKLLESNSKKKIFNDLHLPNFSMNSVRQSSESILRVNRRNI